MVITYHGGHFVKITQGDLTIAINPFSKDGDFKPLRFGSDIALISANDPNMNGVENLEYGDRKPFVVSGPGEYEIRDVAISGFLAPKGFGPKGLLNTIYTVRIEDLTLCFLGALSSAELTAELYEGIGNVDVLFAPIGGGDLLSPADAEKVAVQLDAAVVIPVAWDDKHLAAFKKEMSAEGVLPVDKLTIKKKDVVGKEGEVIILDPAFRP
ncbi:MAG TPA: MBL fold metallo-hydrolase [Candidatus Paceibacterota bacterium]|nr:MBL fold metallo-hydrolase [Candidatus Paceibacterota bacterium]